MNTSFYSLKALLVLATLSSPWLAEAEEIKAAEQASPIWSSYLRSHYRQVRETGQQPIEGGLAYGSKAAINGNSLLETELGLAHQRALAPDLALSSLAQFRYAQDQDAKQWQSFSQERSYQNFPFAWHLSIRSYGLTMALHQTYAENFILDLPLSFEQSDRGSRLGSDSKDLSATPLTLSQTLRGEPALRWLSSASGEWALRFLFIKKIDKVLEDQSYQSYQQGLPSLSLDWQKAFATGHYHLTLAKQQMIVEDPQFDRDRIYLEAQWRSPLLAERWQLFGDASWRQDRWVNAFPVTDSCGASLADESLQLCPRREQGIGLRLGADWHWAEAWHSFAWYETLSVKAENLALWNRQQQSFLFGLSYQLTGPQELVPTLPYLRDRWLP